MKEHFWNFPITKPEADWTGFDRDYVELMRTAYEEGYRPREGPGGCIDLGKGRGAALTSGNGRRAVQ